MRYPPRENLVRIRTLKDRDSDWAERLISSLFGSSRVVSRGFLYETDLLPGLVAEDEATRIGLLQYRIEKRQCEVVVLIAVRKREGTHAFRRHTENKWAERNSISGRKK